MVALNAVLLSILLPAAVLARPNTHEKLHHKRGEYKDIKPSGIHGGYQHHHKVGSTAGTAPFPAGNQTQGAATASGSGTGSPGPVTIQSIISVIPLPVTTGNGGSDSPIQTGAPNGSPSGGANQGPANSGVCGPATVTITAASTVTITVPAAGAQAPSSAAVLNGPVQGPVHEQSNAPTAPVKPVALAEAAPSKPVAPVKEAPPPPAAPSKPVAAIKETSPQPAAPVKETPSKPAEASAQFPKSPVEVVKAAVKPSVAAVQNYKQDTPPQPAKQQIQQPNQQPNKPVEAPKSSPSPLSDTSVSKSSVGSVAAKGILYTSLQAANAMTGLGWGCNWDSSPTPQSGHAVGSLNYQFVPQLWGPQDVHTSIWAGNSAGYPYVMAFNEPNKGASEGGCGPMAPGDAVAPYESHMKDNKAAGQKIISPCVSNDAAVWLDTFLGSTSLKPDAVCFHWYGENLDGLKQVVPQFKAMQQKHGIAELWMSEWGFNVDISNIVEVMSYLASSGIDRHAYNADKFKLTPSVMKAFT